MSELKARYEHWRVVVLSAEAHGPHAPFPMYSPPMAMNAHEWRKAREEGFGVEVLPYGGGTRCTLYRPTALPSMPEEVVAIGETQCSPDDNYVKATGRAKSLGQARRALSQGLLHAEPKE